MAMPTCSVVVTDAGQPQVQLDVEAGAVSGEWNLQVASRYFAGLPCTKDNEPSASGNAVTACADGFKICYKFGRGKAICQYH